MKRSEMIKLLVGVLIKDGAGWAEDRAELCLSAVENAGMIPPSWEDFNPSDSDRYRSYDADWTYHKKVKGVRVMSLKKSCWEKEIL